MMLIEGKFSINGDRGLLKPKMPNINLLYVKNIVEPKLRELAKGRKGENGSDEFTKVYPKMVDEVEIVMPVDENGNFDLEAQKDIVDKILYVEDIKKTIEEYKFQIRNLLIEIETENSSKEFLLSDIFDFPSIKGLTASFIQKNQGNVPVYGGRKDETPIGYIKDNLSNVKYFDNCLAWNREGSVGFVFWHKHRFTTNDHHRPLMVKPQFAKSIDLDYMRYTLEKVLLSQGFEWSKTASKEKVEKFKVTIPILKSGTIDLNTQKEIAAKYLKIDAIKKGILDELDRISKIDIDFE